MTKKGYQKRLPTVLPVPAPRPTATPTPGPRIPAARASADDVEATRAGATAGAAAAPTGAVGPAPDVRAPQPVPPTRLAQAAIVLAAVSLLVLGALVTVRSLLDDPDARPSDAGLPSGARGGGALGEGAYVAADESEVSVRVLDNGVIAVHQRMRLTAPLDRLELAPPTVPGAAVVSASDVRVLADGTPVDGPRDLPRDGATYSFSPATYLDVRYRLAGAVQRSPSVEGRALAVATSLDVVGAPLTSRETRTVRASRVLSLACAPRTDEAPVPCGREAGDDLWFVELTGGRVTARVVAQLELE